MYLDTKVNGERRLLNMALQKHLRIELAGKNSTAYRLRLGYGTFGDTVGIFDNIDDAVSEYENICDALKRGDNYYKAFNDEEAATLDEG
mgnify:CR=1 FL=1